jgi:hypothetical protein
MAGKAKTEKAPEISEEFQCCGKDECQFCPFDEIEVEVIESTPEVAEVEKPAAKTVAPKTYIAQDGDSYNSIAEKFLPKGITRNDYAKHLYNLNNWKSVRPGTEVKL